MNLYEKLKEYLWPFDKISYTPDNWDSLTEREKEPIRMKNRWRLIYLKPYILRWLFVVGIFALCLGSIDQSTGFVGYLVFSVLWAGFLGSVSFTILMFWIYSKRPK